MKLKNLLPIFLLSVLFVHCTTKTAPPDIRLEFDKALYEAGWQDINRKYDSSQNLLATIDRSKCTVKQILALYDSNDSLRNLRESMIHRIKDSILATIPHRDKE